MKLNRSQLKTVLFSIAILLLIKGSEFPLFSDLGPYHGNSGTMKAYNVLFINSRIATAAEVPFL